MSVFGEALCEVEVVVRLKFRGGKCTVLQQFRASAKCAMIVEVRHDCSCPWDWVNKQLALEPRV